MEKKMKTIKKLFAALAAMTVVLAASAQDEKNVRLATAYRTSGIYVFADNDPIGDYEVIEQKKTGMTWSGSYEEVKSKVLKKVAKENPSADGVILNLTNDQLIDKSQVAIIRYKDDNKEKKGKTLVNRINGLCVFADCEPDCDYTILGREKVHVSWSSQYAELRDIVLKKAVKKYPEAEGVILNSHGDQGVIIKFK